MTTMVTETIDTDLAPPESPTCEMQEKRLEDRTVKELRELASKLGIRGRSKLMHKEELVCVIRRRV
ncbi:Rho termination factor N-terminal domain-containing protein [Bremerella sp. JC817]|uniref:Rho termination factor N-terminal domain-containing protein n=1 Tax=Bremerella sp. JC817 TaxID=3231756 RepID=UPI0034592F23